MGSSWKKLAWIWVWRHSRLGLAPRPFGVGADGAFARLEPFKANDHRAYRFEKGVHAAFATEAGSCATFVDANASKDVVVGLNAHYRSHETSLEA
jgi:hypothetical protein